MEGWSQGGQCMGGWATTARLARYPCCQENGQGPRRSEPPPLLPLLQAEGKTRVPLTCTDPLCLESSENNPHGD